MHMMHLNTLGIMLIVSLNGDNFYQADEMTKSLVNLVLLEFYITTQNKYDERKVDVVKAYKKNLAIMVENYQIKLKKKFEKKFLKLKDELEQKIKIDMQSTIQPFIPAQQPTQPVYQSQVQPIQNCSDEVAILKQELTRKTVL